MADLSIIIVSYRGWRRLTKCLESLNAFTGKNFTSEVIVVDNRSDDDTIYNIEKNFPRFRFIHNEINGGFAYGCNCGGNASSGTFLLFLNPDTVATEFEVGKMLDTIRKNPEISILSCRQENENGKESNASGQFPGLFNLTGLQRIIFKRRKSNGDKKGSDLTGDLRFPDWVSGSVVLMRKEMFLKLNGFDEDFWMYFEDVDICRRTRNLGGEVAVSRNISIEHNHGGSSRINLKTASLTKTEVHISRHVYISKHKSGAEKFMIQAFLVINNLISGGIMAIIGLLLFFIPKLFNRTLIYLRLIRYYIISASRFSWISPRSVNFNKKHAK